MRPNRTMTSRSIHARCDRRGVSLLTVLCSLSFVALVAIIAIPMFFGRHTITLDNACKLLSRDLRALQNRAALEKQTMQLAFDVDGWVATDSFGHEVEGLGESHPLVRRFSSDGVFEGVRITKIEVGPRSALAVDTRGLVTEGGRLVLEFDGETREVAIERGSGTLTVVGAPISDE
jgi:hypothetical protein